MSAELPDRAHGLVGGCGERLGAGAVPAVCGACMSEHAEATIADWEIMCPVHGTGGSGWADPGCRGCLNYKWRRAEKSVLTLNGRLVHMAAAIADALDDLDAGKPYDAEDKLRRALQSGSSRESA